MGVVRAQPLGPDPGPGATEARPPVRLAPPQRPLSPQGPVQLQDRPAPLLRTETGRTPSRLEPVVEVDQLQAIDPDSVGVLDESQGGFGIDMWEGTTRSLVERLLPALPTEMASRAMRDLARRLLLSVATVPAGLATEPSLIARRVERLAAMGEVGAVVELLDAAPTQLADETLWRAQVDSLFLTNDHAGACGHVRNLIRQYQDPYWQKAFVFCQALSGEHGGARLGTSLLRETMGEEDAAFFTLVNALMGEQGAVVDSLTDPTALHLAMMRTARQTLPEDAALTTRPAVLRTIAVSPNAELEMRLDAAERAEAAGVLSAEALSQIYSSMVFSPEELANALSVAETEGGPRGRALLYHAAQVQTVPTARAEVLQKAWRLARDSGRYAASVRVNLPLLLEIQPVAELVWFAPDAGRALFFAGRMEEAVAWYNLAADEAAYNPEAAKAWLALWPLAQLGDGDDTLPWDPAIISEWRQSEEQKGGDWQRRVAVLLSLVEGLGERVNGADWEAVLDDQSRVYVSMPAPAIWQGLHTAAEELRIGETVLLALLSLGDDGPAQANPIVLNAVVSSLRFVGLDTESRALAIEAAVAAGI
jgi:hypothetical protein